MKALSILQAAQDALARCAAQRDTPDGERAMPRAVEIYNVLAKAEMTTEQGYLFMIAVKLARAENGAVNADDYIDMAGYAALLGEDRLRPSSVQAKEKTPDTTPIRVGEILHVDIRMMPYHYRARLASGGTGEIGSAVDMNGVVGDLMQKIGVATWRYFGVPSDVDAITGRQQVEVITLVEPGQ